MSWTAILPLKDGPDVKSRLSPRLRIEQRQALAGWMAGRVIESLENTPSIERIVIASESPALAGRHDWVCASRAGLNADLEKARKAVGEAPYLVIHGDLPCVDKGDITALLEAAEAHGAAIAPDQHGVGTNALAIADGRRFEFRFGPDSLEQHLAGLGPSSGIVHQPGLSFDIDTPDDLNRLLETSLVSELSWLAGD